MFRCMDLIKENQRLRKLNKNLEDKLMSLSEELYRTKNELKIINKQNFNEDTKIIIDNLKFMEKQWEDLITDTKKQKVKYEKLNCELKIIRNNLQTPYIFHYINKLFKR